KTIFYIINLILIMLIVIPATAQKKAMTFMDCLDRPRASSPQLSPDNKWSVYTISNLDWDKRKRFTDIYVSSTDGETTKQMTFTPDKNESNPRFTPCSMGITFISDRAGKDHLYFMRIDGGEARNLTLQHKDGIGNYAWSEDGKYIAYTVKEKDISQLWLMPADLSGEPKQLTKHKSSIGDWRWSRLSDKIYFIAPDRDDETERKRKKKKFDVDIKNELIIPTHIWEVDIKTHSEKEVTEGKDSFDSSFTLSKDGKWMGIARYPHRRFIGFYDSYNYGELYLLNLETGKLEKLTDNEIGESSLGFTPDSKYIYYSMSDEAEYMRNSKLFIRPVQSGRWQKMLAKEDMNYRPAFFTDKNTFYSTVGEGVRQNIFKTGISKDKLERITDLDGYISVSYREKNKKVVISYTDPETPADYYIADVEDIPHKDKWIRLTNADPDIDNFIIADCETIHWKSRDGKIIEGLLFTPPDMDKNRKYPLIVQIHGGPASASMRRFSTSYGNYVHLFAANGYVCFQPNYRGSSNYGEKFRMEIAGNYFQKGFEDIMTGVDYLIDKGIAHPDSLGHMGWSAGGHWSNWALVKTDRFKAISSGAGGMNWVSMYAQTDVQKPREFYYKGTPYDNFKGFWDVSPLKFIKNAKTPTLIHCGEKDSRVPRPQSEELYIALQKLGVPSEFIVYPDMPHGLREVRYQMVKMVSEFNWFEKWIRGKEGWFNWEGMLKTLKEDNGKEKKEEK
ncbi:S9 family peptidase, partial [candidate division KSB1 bacterium]